MVAMVVKGRRMSHDHGRRMERSCPERDQMEPTFISVIMTALLLKQRSGHR